MKSGGIKSVMNRVHINTAKIIICSLLVDRILYNALTKKVALVYEM